MSRSALWVSLLASMALAPADTAGAECERIPRCELVWADEFDGAAVDPGKWEFQTGTGTAYGLPAGWGNNELQYYQEANATVAGGMLTITARRESVGGRSYTSARLRTLGRAAWSHGRFEMRARMPLGQGLWPAFWMLPTDTRYGGWAASGEIMEYLGHEPERIHGTIHYGAPWPNNSFSGNTYDLPGGGRFDDDFHVFAVEWQRGQIRWYVDDVLYATQTEWFSTAAPYPAPFDVDFHLLLNLAVGGNFPGPPNDSTSFPQELVVDYVRVYQQAPIKGEQAAAKSLLMDEPVRMKKIEATLAMPFENHARKRDKLEDPREVACSVSAFDARRSLAVKGKVRLALHGTLGGAPWRSATITIGLDRRGGATFDREAMANLVAGAIAAGAKIDRIDATFEGRGGKKVTRADVDCRQYEES